MTSGASKIGTGPQIMRVSNSIKGGHRICNILEFDSENVGSAQGIVFFLPLLCYWMILSHSLV